MARDPFYNTATWKHLRKVKLTLNPLCEVCQTQPATDVDHVQGIHQGGHPTDLNNLRAMCHKCHSRKTLYVERFGKKEVPIKGCTEDGLPLDPKHWWNENKGGQHE